MKFRHCISNVMDWRQHDKLFIAEDFFFEMMSFFEDDDNADEWQKDLINWFNW